MFWLRPHITKQSNSKWLCVLSDEKAEEKARKDEEKKRKLEEDKMEMKEAAVQESNQKCERKWVPKNKTLHRLFRREKRREKGSHTQ